jgi:hypothetical protein
MSIFLTTSDFTILQDKRKETLFTIIPITKDHDISIQLFRSLTKTKILQTATILDNGMSLIMKAHSIKTLDDYTREKLSYSLSLKMVYYLSKQLSYLIDYESKSFYTYDPKNILVIDNKFFLYLSLDHLKEIKNDNIHIYHPIKYPQYTQRYRIENINFGLFEESPSVNHYLSPELSNEKTIPIIIHYKTIFYSLGLLLIDFLSSSINSIKDTKLYYFIKRCLKHSPSERYLLYI